MSENVQITESTARRERQKSIGLERGDLKGGGEERRKKKEERRRRRKKGRKEKKGVHIREFEAEVCRWKQNKDS